MGRTVLSFRPALEREIQSWEDFRRGLKPDDRRTFDELINYTRNHADAGSLSARPELTQYMFMAMLVEHHNEINRLREYIKNLEEKVEEN
ncbi:MAG: hypothetical protein ACTSRE_11715 [Promethearchaeota archaeon]